MERLARTGAQRKGPREGAAQPTPDPAPPAACAPTSPTAAPHEPVRRYSVITYTNGETAHADLAAKDVLSLNPSKVDFFWDKVFGRVSIRTPSGGIQPHVGGIPGLGPRVGTPFLEDILWAMGELLTEDKLNGAVRDGWATPNARDQEVARLRTGFGDSAKLQHFFIVLSRPWRIAWNIARSWRIIER